MLKENLIHINSKNEMLDFESLGISAESNDLRDFAWEYLTDNNTISSFSKGIATKTIPFIFHCDESKANEIKNKFYEHFEIDILNKSYGYFLLNGYKYYCYLTKSTKTNYNIRKRYLELSIEIATDKPYWIKETVKEINFAKEETSNALKYPFTYSFIYRSMNSIKMDNENFIESDAIIRIFGFCVNPLVTINDNIYQIDVSLEVGEYLEIDTEKSTIFKYTIYGDKVNCFNNRNKKYDVFKKIPSGTVSVSANGEFKVDIILYEKRGEPKWI